MIGKENGQINNGNLEARNEAFSEFISEKVTYLNVVKKIVASIVKDEGATEEIVQDTLVEAWDNYDQIISFTEEGRRGWMFTVAKNKSKGHLTERSSKKRGGGIVIESITDALDPAPTPESIIISRDLLYKTLEKIKTFPEKHQEIIIRRAYGYTDREISDELNISKGTVASGLFRSQAKLKDLNRI